MAQLLLFLILKHWLDDMGAQIHRVHIDSLHDARIMVRFNHTCISIRFNHTIGVRQKIER